MSPKTKAKTVQNTITAKKTGDLSKTSGFENGDFYINAEEYATQAKKARININTAIRQNIEKWIFSSQFQDCFGEATSNGENQLELSMGDIQKLFYCKNDNFPCRYNYLTDKNRNIIYIRNMLHELLAKHGYKVWIATKDGVSSIIISFWDESYSAKEHSTCEECAETNTFLISSGETEDGKNVETRLRFDAENNQLDVIAQIEYDGGTSIVEDSITIKYCPFCGRELPISKK